MLTVCTCWRGPACLLTRSSGVMRKPVVRPDSTAAEVCTATVSLVLEGAQVPVGDGWSCAMIDFCRLHVAGEVGAVEQYRSLL